MGRPAKYSREQVQAAALRLVDSEGIEALSMRSLANALGTGAMTLYNHVSNREDLDVLVVEAVIAKAHWSRPSGDDWRDEVRAIALALWRAVRAHPHAIPLIFTRRSRSPAVLAVSEAMLEAISRSGRSGQSLLVAFRSISAFVAGFVQAELAGPLSIEPAEIVIERFRALPRDRYPRLIEIARAAASSDAEREFRAGLGLLLEGLATSA